MYNEVSHFFAAKFTRGSLLYESGPCCNPSSAFLENVCLYVDVGWQVYSRNFQSSSTAYTPNVKPPTGKSIKKKPVP